MNSGVGAKEVLQLYRNLLRYGQQLNLTDKKYYFKRIKEEFVTHKTVEDQKEIEFLFKKGMTLLERKPFM